MADIASLAIQVRTDGVTKASTELDYLDRTSAKVEKQTAKTAAAIDRTALSAKQLAFATRGLPAQFTDIATSLASGQNPLTVLLQQGGQIKDTFGGAVPALRAVGGYVLGLLNPLTLTAAAVAALGVAWNQAASEGDAFNRALILTGNYAKTTADDLSAMADRLDDTTSATQGKAADVLAQVAATGRFTAEQINLVAEAAIRMEDATGKAIEDTVKEFVSLQGDPVNAILKLNEAQHFLTQETLDQIESLKEQGREAEASGVAVRAYADTINDRAPRVVENLGLFSTAWRGVKHEAKEAWDAVVNGFRDADKAAGESLQSMRRYFSSMPFGPGGAAAAAFAPTRPLAGTAVAPARTVDTEAANAKIKAEEEFGRIVQSNLSKQKALEAEINRIKEVGNKAGKSAVEIEAQIAAAKAKAADHARKPRAGAVDPGVSILAQVRQQIALNTEADKSQGSLTQSERLRIQVLEKLNDANLKISDSLRAKTMAELASLEASDKALQQSVEVAEVNALIDQESAQAVRELEAERRRMLESNESLISDMQFEYALLGKNNLEREKAIALRQLEAGATEEQRRAVEGLAEELARTHEQIGLMDQVRGTLSDTFADFITGATSAKDAFKDLVDSILEQAAHAVSDQLVQQLFGSFGSAGGGSAGGNWFASLAGLFAGGRAIGGPVSAGRMYEVGERGPELLQMHGRNYLVPAAAGKVTPLASGAGGSSQGGVILNQNIHVTGTVDKRSASQIAVESGRRVRLATSRNG